MDTQKEGKASAFPAAENDQTRKESVRGKEDTQNSRRTISKADVRAREGSELASHGDVCTHVYGHATNSKIRKQRQCLRRADRQTMDKDSSVWEPPLRLGRNEPNGYP